MKQNKKIALRALVITINDGSLISLIAEEDQKNNSSLLAHIANLPGFDASTARFATQYSTRSSPEKSVMEIVPTAAELMLPWRRERPDELSSLYQSIGTFCMKLKCFEFFLIFFFFSSFRFTFSLCLVA